MDKRRGTARLARRRARTLRVRIGRDVIDTILDATARAHQHVVVVDDAATNVDILTAIVGDRERTTVHGFTSSRDALDYARTNTVDGFVVDYNMPAPDGLEMIRLLRADPRYQYVPIVIVTAEHERETRLRALLAGANDFIERPIEPRELLARLDTLLTLESAHQQLTSRVGELEHSLVAAERQSRAQAERLAALWTIVSNTSLSAEDVSYNILHEGARAMRPGHQFFGSLYRFDGDDIVLEARAPANAMRRGELRPGARAPLGDTLSQFISTAGTTRSWPDLDADPVARELKRVKITSARAAICTSFRAGRATYALMFWSREPLATPFTPEDTTYVELLANFFASRVEQAWQVDRMTYHLAHDILTGLRNRTQFRLDARTAYVSHGRGAMAVISLDGFRAINERYGHIIGDALLVEVGAAIERRAVGDDVVARLAGDTFGVFLAGFGDDESTHVRLQMLAAAFEHPFSTGDREGKEFIPLSATIGACVATDAESTIEAMIAHAETAVFAAKRERKHGGIRIYEPGMESAEMARERLSAEIAQAIERNEFELYFQPHIDLETMRVAGAEALIRWNHPTRGVLAPDEFIPFAEEYGQIKAISAWVLHEVLASVETFRAIDPAFRLYFNLSAADVADMSIVDALRAAAAGGAPLANVGVELTETMAMRDVGVTVQTIRALQELGVHVAIDDFGVGYSSLSLLKRIPVDVVKIDRSFVGEILSDPRDAAIAEAVMTFGRQFGFETLGEGVETPEQRDWLASHRCRYAQGYHIAHPAPLADFVRWLAAR